MTTRFTKGQRWLVGSSIVLVLLTLVALRLPALVDQRIASLLADYGVVTYQRGAARVGLTGAVVDRLFMQGSSGSVDYSLTLEDAQADYHWRTLISGQLTAVSIPVLDVEVVLRPSDESAQQPIDLDQLRQTLANIELPLDDLTIDRLHVALTLADGKKVEIAGQEIRLSNKDKSLSGALTLTTPDHTQLENLETTVSLLPGSLPWVPDVSVSMNMAGQPVVQSQLKIYQEGTENLLSLKVSGRLQHNNILTLLGDRGESLIAPFAEKKGGNSGDNTSAISPEIMFTGQLPLPQELDTSDPAWWQHLPFNGSLDSRLDVQGVKVEGFKPSTFAGKISATGSLDHLLITLAEPVALSGEFDAHVLGEFASDLSWQGAQPVDVTLTAAEPIEFAWQDTLPPLLGMEGLELNGVIGPPSSAARFNLKLATLRVNKQGLAATFQVEANAPYGNRQLPRLTVSGEIQQQSETVQGSGLLGITDWLVDGSWQYSTQVHPSGQFSATTQFQDLALLGSRLSTFNLLPEPLSLASGRANLSVDIKLPSTNTPSSKPAEIVLGVNTTDFSGLYNGMAFENVTLSGQVKKDAKWQSVQPFVIHADNLSAGVPVTDVNVQVGLERSPDLFHTRWSINQLQGELFGGSISLDHPAGVSVPFSGNKLDIKLSNLDLAQVLVLYKEQGVSGRGQLNGSLPVVLEAEGVRIARGIVTSSMPGQIAYRANGASEAMADSHAQLDTTLRLLEDFHYDSLQVTTDFSPSGLMVLDLKLSGRNPAEFDGRLVNFNINVEENLYDLLKVLQLTDELTNSLEKQLDKRRRQRK